MLLPAITGSGESDLVTARSACETTLVVAVLLLLAALLSALSAVVVAVLVSVVPAGVAAPTLTVMVNVAISAFGTFAFSKVIVPVPPAATESVRVHPTGRAPVETNVVLAGIASVTLTPVELSDPLFLKTMV